MKVIDLNELISNIIKMVSRLITEEIEVKPILNTQIGSIRADPSQVEQIIMNMAVNAKDAMPEGGTLFIETDSADLDEDYCTSHANLKPGSYIQLIITDTAMECPPTS